ncbi:MAG: HPF/RaiA family ribosome-associated protein [Clostridia bacterium]|nr:HPF/RaiA family ribosome-associated protein [Clostridia bacterium]
MTVRFVTKDARLPEKVLRTMEKKLQQRLGSYYRNEAADATTVLVKIAEKKNIFKVEINMPYGGQLLRTENEERDSAMPALDKGVDVLERQVKRHKTRMTRHLRDSIKPGEDAGLLEIEAEAGDDAAAEEDFRVVKIKRYEAKPMTVQDAVLQMELLGHSFYMFHNTDNNKVCTAYRRNDGDYGLIELA